MLPGIRNNGGAFAIAANNFQKTRPNSFGFPTLNYKGANSDLVLIQKPVQS